jgi:hypothetical protein
MNKQNTMIYCVPVLASPRLMATKAAEKPWEYR